NDKEEVLKLISDINKRLGDAALAPDRLTRSFEQNWPTLEAELGKILVLAKSSGEEKQGERRSADDLLNEVLLLARHQDRRLAELERVIDFIAERNASIASVATGERSKEGWRAAAAGPVRSGSSKEAAVLADTVHNRLGEYGVEAFRKVDDHLRVQITRFPQKDEIQAFREATRLLADEIQLTVRVYSSKGMSYRHDWPF
ncbi:hypothetical protein ABT408_36510, partial [Streptomyces halstedii]|uniref:hypothetical protein n=1 Tax=Streptomyces halstedii TaxID=1944 RepID=UPI00335B4FCD